MVVNRGVFSYVVGGGGKYFFVMMCGSGSILGVGVWW